MRIVHLTLPKAWHELTEKQLLKVSQAFLENLNRIDFLVNCFLYLTELKSVKKKIDFEDNETWYHFKKDGEEEFCIDIGTFTSMLKNLEWLYNIGPVKVLPQIGNYRSCNVQLYNVSLEEYITADNLYIAYSKSGDTIYLDQLLAIVYKQKDEEWNGKLLKRRAKRFKSVSEIHKHAVYLWFTGVKIFLKNKYPAIWPKNSTGNTPPDEVIFSLLSSLNNGDVTANEKIYKSHVHEALYQLNLKAQQSPKNKGYDI